MGFRYDVTSDRKMLFPDYFFVIYLILTPYLRITHSLPIHYVLITYLILQHLMQSKNTQCTRNWIHTVVILQVITSTTITKSITNITKNM